MDYSTYIYLFKVHNRNRRSKICSELTVKTQHSLVTIKYENNFKLVTLNESNYFSQ